MTPKQQQFVREYLIDLNATKAADRAGYKQPHSQGHRLLENVEIAAAVQHAMNQRAEKTGITSEVVLQELLRLARVDISEAFNEDGSLKPIKEIPEDVRRAISAVEVDEIQEGRGDDRRFVGYTRKVKFWDKKGALELLGKHLKLFTDKVEHSGAVSYSVVTGVPDGSGG